MRSDNEPSLAVIRSSYQTEVTLFTFAGLVMEQVLESNPKRWYVEFQVITGAGSWRLSPEPLAEPTINGQIEAGTVLSYKYRDCPSVVTGEWYATSILGSVLQITECIYLR